MALWALLIILVVLWTLALAVQIHTVQVIPHAWWDAIINPNSNHPPQAKHFEHLRRLKLSDTVAVKTSRVRLVRNKVIAKIEAHEKQNDQVRCGERACVDFFS